MLNWAGRRTTCVRTTYDTHYERTTNLHTYDIPYAIRTHIVRLAYAFLSYVALNMPAYDKNTLLSYVGIIAYEVSYVDCTTAVRCCTSPVHTQMQKRHAHHMRPLTN